MASIRTRGKSAGTKSGAGIAFGVPVNKSELDTKRYRNAGAITFAEAVSALRPDFPRNSMEL